MSSSQSTHTTCVDIHDHLANESLLAAGNEVSTGAEPRTMGGENDNRLESPSANVAIDRVDSDSPEALCPSSPATAEENRNPGPWALFNSHNHRPPIECFAQTVLLYLVLIACVLKFALTDWNDRLWTALLNSPDSHKVD